MRMQNLYIWGIGSHAKVIAEAAKQGWQSKFFIDESRSESSDEFLSGLQDTKEMLKGHPGNLILGFGQLAGRRTMIDDLQQENIRFATVVHQHAIDLGSDIGLGTFIAAGAIAGVDAIIGNHCVINTAASVDHDCVLGSNVHVAPGARLCGRVNVGHDTLIGAGAVILPRVTIGHNCTIGAGATVLCDVPPNTIAVGIVKNLAH